MRARVKEGLKAAVTVALLVFLVHQIGPGRLWEAFSRARPLYLVLAFVVICTDAAVRAFNWRLALAARGDRVPYLSVFQSFAVGGFVGSFVPSSLGVEAGRAVTLAARSDLSVARTASSLVMLSLSGFWGLGVLFLGAVGGLSAVSTAPSSLGTLAMVALAGTVMVPALLWVRGAVPEVDPDRSILSRLARFGEALASYRDVRGRLLPVFAVALLNQVFAVFVFYLVFRAAGVSVHPLYFPVLVPVVTLARLVPATIAGFGGEQAAVVVAFGWVGVDASFAMAGSLLVSLLNGLFLAGCGLYFAGENVRSLLRGAVEGRDGAPGLVARGEEPER